MRMLLPILLGSLVLLFSACESGGKLSDAISELQVYNADTGALIAQGSTGRGAITFNIGDTRRLRVMRQVTDDQVGTVTTNVTATADYNIDNNLVLAVDDTIPATGIVTAVGAGSAALGIKFRDDNGDPTDDDEAFIDFTVIP